MTCRLAGFFFLLLLATQILPANAEPSAGNLKNVSIVDNHVTGNQTREAYSQPFTGLTDAELAQFFRGRTLFRQSWGIAPASGTAVGLGPLYNRIACVSCHLKNGRGRAPDNAQERMQSMLVRLSVPGTTLHGAPKPHPRYGNQFNEEGIPGVPGEGRVQVHWQYHKVNFADGTAIRLRKPQLHFSELHYGALYEQQQPILTSARIGPSVYGLGLLDAVSEDELQKIAQQPKPDGVTGNINRVWDIASQQTRHGRFGAKANVASLRSQIAEAMHGDLGITSSLLPQENCQPQQTACLHAARGGTPELTDEQLTDLEFYLLHLAVPARRHRNDPQVKVGEKIFIDTGCAVCHRTELRTAKNYPHKHLANLSIHPYTDLLLHDMGAGLADNRPDFKATGREWRTTPLWGIGLTAFISEYQAYLHDGRAQSLTEAILWHGGEAQTARERYRHLSQQKRDALEQFLLSL